MGLVLSILVFPIAAYSQDYSYTNNLAFKNGAWGFNSASSGFVPFSDVSVESLTKLLGGAGGGPHPICVQWMQMKPPPQPPPPCYVPSLTILGNVIGVCTPTTLCRGISAPGLGGGFLSLNGTLPVLGGATSFLSTLGQLSPLVSAILGKLMQGGSDAPPSSADNATNSQTPATAPSTSEFLTNEPFQPLDMSKLFSDSAAIVRDLLFALNPQAEQDR